MLLAIIHLYFEQKRKNAEFKEYGGWVTISIIDKKTNRRSDHCRIDFHYKSRTNTKIYGFENCPNEYIYDELKIGDTILIKHSNKDVENYKIYNYFPTHTEIERFKDGMPYEAIKNDKK